MRATNSDGRKKVVVSEGLHGRLKVLAAKRSVTLEALIDDLLRPAVTRLEKKHA